MYMTGFQSDCGDQSQDAVVLNKMDMPAATAELQQAHIHVLTLLHT